MRPIPRRAAVALALSCAASVASAQAVGPEFQINTYTTGYQGNFFGGKHSIATDGSGNFVVVWHSDGSSGTDTSGTSIQARRFSASGNPIGDEFQVNTFTTSDQTLPSVAAVATGGFLVAWVSNGSSEWDASGDSIQARLFDASGNPIGDQFQVNTFTTSHQGWPSVAAHAGIGGFIVAWQSDGSSGTDASGDSIQARRFDALGLGNYQWEEFQVNTFTTGKQVAPSVAAHPGGFVVAWHSYGSPANDASGYSIQAQRFDSFGTPIGNDFQVNAFTTSAQRQPSVAADGSGGFTVAWVSYGSAGNDASDDSIQARRFDWTGSALGDDFQVNTYTTSFQRWPSVAADADGRFVVSWISYGSSGTDNPGSYSIQARRFESSGSPAGDDFQVNTFTTSHQTSPSVAMGPGGRFVVAWMSYQNSDWGVFGQRLAFDVIFADGFE